MVIAEAKTAKSGSEDFKLFKQSAFIGVAGRRAQAKKALAIGASTLTTTAGLEGGKEGGKEGGRVGVSGRLPVAGQCRPHSAAGMDDKRAGREGGKEGRREGQWGRT